MLEQSVVKDTDEMASCYGQMSMKSKKRKAQSDQNCIMQRRSFSTIFKSILIMTALVATNSGTSGSLFVSAEEPIKYEHLYLEGIGYREQELQLAKGTNFDSEEATGVPYVSFGGGTNIFIKGVGLNFSPEKNTVKFTSHEKQVSFMAPPLTEEDQFNSHPQLGTIGYRIPSISEIFEGIPEAQFDHYGSLTFWISVVAKTDFDEDALLECKENKMNNCRFIMRRDYTPHVYYISPRVTYYDSYTTVVFNPKSTMNLIKDLDSDELPFINAKVGGNLLDFEFNVDFETGYNSWSRNTARGQVGENTISKLQDISMHWETGKATVNHVESTFCNFDQSDCYKAKSVPVIFGVSANSGYRTGGQNITVTGYGFDSGAIEARIDGHLCKVTQSSRTQFSCTVQAAPQASDLAKKYVGQHGMRRKFVNETSMPDYKNMDQYTGEERLSLNFEAEKEYGDYLGSTYKAWFVPPTDGRYRFYMTCDDKCLLQYASCPDTTSPLITLLDITWATSYRDYFSHTNFAS